MGGRNEDITLASNLDLPQPHSYCVIVKNLTISIPDDLYRRARSKAAATEISLSRFVQDFLARWASAEQSRAELVARLDALFAESDAGDRTKRGSAGPFPREEIYAARLERFR